MRNLDKVRKLALLGISSFALFAGSGVNAQDSSGSTDEDQADGERDGVGIIIVEAQKRAQSLQEVPLSITAVSGEDLASEGIQGVQDLQTAVPGFNSTSVVRPGASAQFFIRGVGTPALDGGMEASVGLFLDGVYRSRSGQGVSDLVDVEAVEVLRGPQGTLFGKNTSAGAVVVRTNDPVHDLEGSVQASIGNLSLRRFQGVLNVPLAEDVAALRVAAGFNQRDGVIDDLGTGAEYNDKDRWSIRGKLLLSPTDNLEMILGVSYAEVDESCCLPVPSFNNPAFDGFLSLVAPLRGGVYINPARPEDYVTSANYDVKNQVESLGVTFDVEWDLGGVELFSQTSYQDYKSANFDQDADFGPADFFRNEVFFDSEQFSQELRLSGTLDGIGEGLDWLVGFYYAEEDIDWTDDVPFGPDLAPFFGAAFGDPALGALYGAASPGLLSETVQSNTTWAIFTHNIFDVTDRFQIVAGLRYSSDEKSGVSTPTWFTGPNNPAVGGLGLPFSVPNGWDLDFEDDAITGTFSASYDLADDVSVYFTYGRGFKSGGFSFERDGGGPAFTVDPTSCDVVSLTPVFPGGGGLPPSYACRPADPSFESETVDSYEVGLRSIVADGQLLFNATAFWADFSNLQLAQFNGLGFNVRNAGSLTSKGFEAEAVWSTPLEGLELSGNVSYADVEFGDGVSLGVTPFLLDVGGEAPRNSPHWQAVLSGMYNGNISDSAEFYLRASYSYTSSQLTELRRDILDPTQFDKIDDFGLLNLGAGITLENGLSLSALCRNCTDEVVVTQRIPTPGFPGSTVDYLGTPREFVFTLGYKF